MASLRRPAAVMLSKRANVFYLEHARVLQKADRVVYLTDRGEAIEDFFNIPDKNTAFLLLGKGTSITDAAARKLSESNVLVGFCGSGGSPLFSVADLAFLVPQDEYRPTDYLQGWLRQWVDEERRLGLARQFLRSRVQWTRSHWTEFGLTVPEAPIQAFEARLNQAKSTTEILSAEGLWAKALYAELAQREGWGFRREAGKRSTEIPIDRVNGFLDHGNYLAYGYAAVALHGLGIPYALPVLHGKTRRGALVFDVADLVKDGWILPLAFSHAAKGSSDQAFRGEVIDRAQRWSILDHLFTFLSEVSKKDL